MFRALEMDTFLFLLSVSMLKINLMVRDRQAKWQ
jgi:hypothetical protein